MNRQYRLYGLLFIVLTNTIQLSASQQDALLSFFGHAAFLSGGQYVIGKISGKYQEGTLPDAPPHFQKWARKILAENGLENAATIPLKMSNGWECHKGIFISGDFTEIKAIDDIIAGREVSYSNEHQAIILDNAHESLLHEIGHYISGDFGKQCLLGGTATALLFPIITRRNYADVLTKKESLPIAVGGMALAAGGSFVASVAYARHQEKEADRYAFMRIPEEKLLRAKAYWKVQSDIFEEDLLNNNYCYSSKIDLLKKPIFSLLSQRLRDVDDAMSQGNGNREELHQKRHKITKLAYFVMDSNHPHPLDRAALAQECYDKRKADRRDKLIKKIRIVGGRSL